MIECYFEDQDHHQKGALLRHVVADVLVLDQKKENILLVLRSQKLIKEPGKWALPGGYVDRDETVCEAAIREVREETGYELQEIEFVKYQDDPHRPGEDRQNISFVWLATAGEKLHQHDDESELVRWWPINDLPKSEAIGFDHEKLIRDILHLS